MRKRNFVVESAIAALNARKDNCEQDKLDSLTGEKITRLDYMVIFLNDQIYNSSLMLEDSMKKNGFMRFEAKNFFKGVKECIERYNAKIDRMGEDFIELVADITSSMEEDIQPHLDKYRYRVSQLLLDAGIDGAANQVLSILEQMILMSTIAQSCIGHIEDMFYEHTMLRGRDYTKFLRMESVDVKIRRLSNQIASKVLKKEVTLNFGQDQQLIQAFEAIKNKLFDAKVYDKAFENWS